MTEFVDPFEEQGAEVPAPPEVKEPVSTEEAIERIDQMATEPLETTGRPPSPAAVAKAKALVTAASLLPPELEIREEPPDEDTPPDEAAPTFRVRRNAYGPGAHSVLFADGTPVGVWARGTGWLGAQVEAHLLALGLDADLAHFYGRNRDKGREADSAIAAHPTTQAFAAEEERIRESKKALQAAFVDAYRKKEKK